jgi:hypothetical protein
MTRKDFKQAIESLGIQDLKVLKYSHELNGGVAAVYAKMGSMTFLKWDGMGRGFRFDMEAGVECCISSATVYYLDYRRDADFDLRF